MARRQKAKIICLDARATSLLVRKYLLEHAGHDVITATDVESGFRLLEDHAPDLVLIDESLAAQAKHLLKRKKEESSIPVLLIADMPFSSSDLRTCVDDVVWRAEPVEVLLNKIGTWVGRNSSDQT